MAIQFGTSKVNFITYNNSVVQKVVYNNTEIYASPLKFTLQYDGTSYYYSVGKGTYVSPVGECVIPSEINGKEVRTIEADGFKNCNNLTKITIPGTIKTIPSGAFYGCLNLTDVTGCGGVTSIGKNAFRDCPQLQNYHFDVALKSIGEYAFYNCYQLNIETALYDTSIQTIETSAFRIATSGVTPTGRTNVALPQTINSLKPYSFTHVANMSMPYPSTWDISEYDDTDSEYYDTSINITSSTNGTSIANRVCADAYWNRTDTVTQPLVSVDSENNIISVAVTNPLSTQGTASVVVYHASKSTPTSFNRLDSQSFTIKGKETVVTYFGSLASYYMLKVEATITGCSKTTTITEVNESYAEQTN